MRKASLFATIPSSSPDSLTVPRQRHSVAVNFPRLHATALIKSVAQVGGSNSTGLDSFNINRQEVMPKLFMNSNEVFKAWETILRNEDVRACDSSPIDQFSTINSTTRIKDKKKTTYESNGRVIGRLLDLQKRKVRLVSPSQHSLISIKSVDSSSLSTRFNSLMILNKKKMSSSEYPSIHLEADTSNLKRINSCRPRSCGRGSSSPVRPTNCSSPFSSLNPQPGASSAENISSFSRRRSSTINNHSRYLQAQPFKLTQGECELNRRMSGVMDFDKSIKNVQLEDEYNIYKQLGTGRFGFVRLAEHRSSGKKIALKFFPRPQIKQADFIREYNFSRFLSPHQNIIDTFEGMFHSMNDCAFFFVQEFCPYASLRETVEASNGCGIGEATTKAIMLKALSAIEFMHSEGLVHRNIKAENILIFDNANYSRVKVTDFGLTRKTDTTVKHLEYVNVYHAPELCETVVKEVLTVARSIDLWALGVTFFYALKGRFPWQKATIMCKPYWEWNQWLKHKLPQLPKQYEAFTEKALKLFKRCLNPRPKDRWSVKDLKKFVEKERLLKIKPQTGCDDSNYYPCYDEENTKNKGDASPGRAQAKKSTIHKLINNTFNAMAEISEQVVSAWDE